MCWKLPKDDDYWLSPLLYWSLTDKKIYVYLMYTVEWFDTCIPCEMFTPVNLTHPLLYIITTCVCVCVRVCMLRSILLTKFQCIIHNTIFTMPSIISSEIISYNLKSLLICNWGSQNQIQVQLLFAQKSMFKR